MQLFIPHADHIGGDTMPRFNKNKIKELKDFLYNSCVHDAKLENFTYKRGEDIIKIKLFNPIYNVKIYLSFYNIGIVLAMKGKAYGSRETIISLTAEEDFTYLQNHLPNQSEGVEESLYILFQMFSGDELHIVAREVSVEIEK